MGRLCPRRYSTSTSTCMFDLGPRHRTLSTPAGATVCDLGSNRELPFRADPSMRLVGIKVYGGYVDASSPFQVRLQDRNDAYCRTCGMVVLRKVDTVHLLHSHLACLHQSITSIVPCLRVLDIPLKRKRREGNPDVEERSERLIPVGKEI
ncbi:hypothetical protein BDM02DRAFT_3124756 [Thelephora ganbajun]|uniref:Uncharacterized protein n=1 Tax=Thelephora ganbajun TaxID=370292 RepID=A0ACB6YYR2_THEGA|nr:hypothetical protein BDM02DRAFT_3124756 [Thelephora ganbajun]